MIFKFFQKCEFLDSFQIQALIRWVNMAPYQWCKTMLYHAEHSDTPQSLLKLIAPADSNIVDDAAGVRVRLRLGVHSDQER